MRIAAKEANLQFLLHDRRNDGYKPDLRSVAATRKSIEKKVKAEAASAAERLADPEETLVSLSSLTSSECNRLRKSPPEAMKAKWAARDAALKSEGACVAWDLPPGWYLVVELLADWAHRSRSSMFSARSGASILTSLNSHPFQPGPFVSSSAN